MTADQQAAETFDREWQHALSGLPPRPCLAEHAATLKHRRCELGLQELLHYYSRKLPVHLLGPRLLAAGEQLQERHDYRLAAELCYQRLVDLDLPNTPDSSRKLDAAGRMGLHVQALYGLHACNADESLFRDSSLQQQHTATAALSALAGLQAACQQVLPAQPLLVLTGTQHIHKVACKLLQAGLHAQVLPFLQFAAHAMECHISLSTTQHLPWRVQLYAAAAECHYALVSSAQPPQPDSNNASASSSPEAAASMFAAGLSHLASIARAQSLDAVPAPEVTAAVEAARAQLSLLQVLFEQQPVAGSTGTPLPGGSSEAQAGAGQLLASIRAIGGSKQQLEALLRLLQIGLPAHTPPLQRMQLPPHLQPVLAAAAELAGAVLSLDAAAAAQVSDGHKEEGAGSKTELHMDLLGVAFRYQQQDLLQKLPAAALQSSAAGGGAKDNGKPHSSCLVATAAVFEAVSKLQETPGDATMQHLSAMLVQHSAALSTCKPSLLAAAALELHAAAGPLLQGCFSRADGNADAAQAVLAGLHAALQGSAHTDGVLRGSAALWLGSLLEQQQQLGEAFLVVQQGLAAVEVARCDALTHLQGSGDEHLRWISGSRTQPEDRTAALLEGMSDTEQVLACLHADALLLRARLELKLGLQEAAAKVAARQERLQATLQKRDQQADIFGARTRKERRLDAAAVDSAGVCPQTAPEVEQRLLLACGRCPYQRALVLTATALVQPDATRQQALLEEACDALQAAHTSEAELFASQQPPSAALRPVSAHHIRPSNPRVLCRTPNGISLGAHPVEVSRGGQQPAMFAAFCKPCAAGVSLTVNKTAMEYPGSGVPVPMGGRVMIEGLQSNEAYNFAVAVYDDQGTLMGELGCSSPPITMSLPLPVYYCYAQVLLAAAQLGLWTVAKGAASILLSRFFTTTPSRPVWEAHPADRLSIQLQQVAMQVPAFLRLLVQAVYAYAGHLGAQHTAALSAGSGYGMDPSQDPAARGSSSSGLAGTAASRELLLGLSGSHIHQQVALLEVAQRHLLAMQVAAQAGDEMLVEEGAVRVLNLLQPLLQQQDISPALFQPLEKLHSTLAAVKDTAPSSISGHRQQRQAAAQVLAASGLRKLWLLQPVTPGLASGSAAVAAHGVLGLKLQPASALNTLEGALLSALSNGGAAASGAAVPAAAAQETSTSPAKAGKGGAGSKQAQEGHKGTHKGAGADAGAAAPLVRVPVGEQAQELSALHELLLWHPQGTAWAADLHASRCADPQDLVAQVLPKLQQPHALTTCWPLLAAPTAQSHPKWLPLCMLLMQAAAKQHGYALWLSFPAADKSSSSTQDSTSNVLVGVPTDSLPDAARPAAAAQLAPAATTALELLQAVKQYVRMAARRPQMLAWPSSPKWTVEAAAAALESEGFVLGDTGTTAAGPQPEAPAGTTAAAKAEAAAAAAAWQKETTELANREGRRLAATVLLQQRLPVLLGRRLAILAARRQLADWAPWLAQLHCIVGGLAAEAAAQLLALAATGPAQAPAAAPAATVPDAQTTGSDAATTAAAAAAAAAAGEAAGSEAADSAGAGAGSGNAAAVPAIAAAAVPASDAASTATLGSSRPGSPRKGGAEGTRPQTAAGSQATTTGTIAGKPSVLEEVAKRLAVQVHQQFAQAATLSARAGNVVQLSCVSKQLQGLMPYLLNKLPALLDNVPAVTWSIGPLPDPLVPPLAAAALDRTPTDPTGAAGAGAKGAAGDKKGAGAASGKAAGADKKQQSSSLKGGKGTPRADARHTLLPEAQRPHVGAALRAVAAALAACLQGLRAQASKPRTPPSRDLSTAARATGTNTVGGSSEPLTARSNTSVSTTATATAAAAGTAADAASVFSFGLDAVVEAWHRGRGVDVQGLTQLLVLLLRALHKMERWRCVLELGASWRELCQGSADGVLVPLLLGAARASGADAELASLTAAQQALAADREAVVLDDLAKVRRLAVECLQGLPPLDAVTLDATTTASGGSSSRSNGRSLGGVGGTWAGARSAEEQLPSEYARVVGQLKKRGEKGHMILALNELGDIHAHFGSWPAAAEAWSSAVDALLGPYHVVDTWRHSLTLGSSSELLARYGVHGLLLAGKLLGKLARYSYHADLGARLRCALLAAKLLPAVFRSHILHPQRRVDYAAYTPLELWPGVDVFDDPYRCNAAALTSSLECLSSILQEQQLHLLSLPLLSLFEHTSLYISHDRASTVLARVTRVRALAALGLMPQAAAVLQCLLEGSNLPGLVLAAPQPLLAANGLAVGLGANAAAAAGKGGQAQGGKQGSPAGAEAGDGRRTAAGAAADGDGDAADGRVRLFHADKWPRDPANAAFLQHVAEVKLEQVVAEAYGPWLCGHLTLARASFLAAAGGALDCWVVGKPSVLTAAVRAGPPPPVDPSTAPADTTGEAGTAAAGGPAARPVTPSSKGAGKAPAAGAAGSAAAGKAAAAAAAAAATAGSTPVSGRTPGEAELKLLAAAARLVQSVVTTSCAAAGLSGAVLGIPWADEGAPVVAGSKHPGGKGGAGKDNTAGGGHSGASTARGAHATGKAGTKGGTATQGKGKHGSSPTKGSTGHQQQQEHAAGADSADEERKVAAAAELLAAQHQQLLVTALLQLAATQCLRLLPLQALPVCVAACEAVKHGLSCSDVGGLVCMDSLLDSSQSEVKALLQPGASIWLAARCQLARVLLQLRHTGPCASVCLKALTDAGRCGDVAWSVQLMRLQAAALAAQEDYVGALNSCRTALARLEEHGMPGCLLLPLQLEYAALCDCVGPRGDRLATAALGISSTVMQDLGLAEMMEHPQLTNVYLPAATTHLTALLQAAAAATRRRQLASAERHLRAAADMLRCCRCLPMQAAAVLAGLARVLRLQAALKLPDTGGGTGLLAHNKQQQQQQQQPAGVSAGSPSDSLVMVPSSTGSTPVLQLQQRRLYTAVHLLGSSLQVLVQDCGSSPMLVRSVLLELAAVFLQDLSTKTPAAAPSRASQQIEPANGPSAGQGPAHCAAQVPLCGADPAAAAAKVAAVLRAAHVSSSHVCKLLLESHSLLPLQSPSSTLPDWLVECLKGAEQLQQSCQQTAAAAAAAAAAGHSSTAAPGAASAPSGSTSTLSSSKALGGTGAASSAATLGSTATKEADSNTAGSSVVLPQVPDAVLGRLALCFYVQQLLDSSSCALGPQQQAAAAQQALLLHPALRAACPRFAAECCWPDVPPEVVGVLGSLVRHVQQPVPALPAGAVVLQWYRQDGCWQVPSSWSCHGVLPPAGQLSATVLDALPQQHPCVSCLYVLVMPAGVGQQPMGQAAATGSAAAAAVAQTTGGELAASAAPVAAAAAAAGPSSQSCGPMVLQGELVVDLLRAKRVQLQVKAMRSRLQSLGRPTDILAQPPPTPAELASVKHCLECMLAGVAEDDMPQPPDDLPAPPSPQQQQGGGTTPAAASAAGAVKAVPAGTAAAAAAAAAGKPPLAGAKGSSAAGSAAGAGPAAAPAKTAGGTVAGAASAAAGGSAANGGSNVGLDASALYLDWRSVETWSKAELLVDLEGGLQATDPAVAVWLGGILQGAGGRVCSV